jgi:hypothetical protein
MALTTLGDKPLIVVSATVDAQSGWLDAQKEVLGLSSNVSRRIATDQSHGSLIESASGAAIATKAVLDGLASLRSGRPVQ